MMWRPSPARDENWCRRYKISQHRIDLLHIHQDRLALITDGSLRVYLIDEELELVLVDSVQTGSRYYERLTVTAGLGRVVFSSVAERDVTQYDMSAVSWTTFQIGQKFRVRKLELSTELTHLHLLLVIGLATFYVGYFKLDITRRATGGARYDDHFLQHSDDGNYQENLRS